jgi:hypothetical protein
MLTAEIARCGKIKVAAFERYARENNRLAGFTD